jgi:hypothetical protein
MNIRLHIEELVIEGFGARSGDVRTLKGAVQSELARLLRVEGVGSDLRQSGAVPRVAADPLRVEVKPSPRQLGMGIARSVYGGFGRGR